MSSENDPSAYWRANIRLVKGCLVVWALVSFGLGIVLRPLLSGIVIGGTDLGFWFAQQGSIITFMLIIFFYSFRMNSLDRKFGVDEAGAAAVQGDRPAIRESDKEGFR